jgi:hypothetical protein
MENDGSSSSTGFLGGLKLEWNLFWLSLTEATENEENKIESLSQSQLNSLKRVLSNDKKLLNQKLESLKKEIDLNLAKLEALKLVGAPTEDTFKNLESLHDVGEKIATEINKIDEKLKATRLIELEQ